jgi:hypothetical protein
VYVVVRGAMEYASCTWCHGVCVVYVVAPWSMCRVRGGTPWSMCRVRGGTLLLSYLRSVYRIIVNACISTFLLLPPVVYSLGCGILFFTYYVTFTLHLLCVNNLTANIECQFRISVINIHSFEIPKVLVRITCYLNDAYQAVTGSNSIEGYRAILICIPKQYYTVAA